MRTTIQINTRSIELAIKFPSDIGSSFVESISLVSSEIPISNIFIDNKITPYFEIYRIIRRIY